jgi:hypothetical protein
MKLYRCIKTFECCMTIDDRPVDLIIPYGNVSVFEDTDFRTPNPTHWEEIDVVVAPVKKRKAKNG